MGGRAFDAVTGGHIPRVFRHLYEAGGPVPVDDLWNLLYEGKRRLYLGTISSYVSRIRSTLVAKRMPYAIGVTRQHTRITSYRLTRMRQN